MIFTERAHYFKGMTDMACIIIEMLVFYLKIGNKFVVPSLHCCLFCFDFGYDTTGAGWALRSGIIQQKDLTKT
jgi:hypothetical protein